MLHLNDVMQMSGWDWDIGDLWRWMDWLERLVLVVLAVMLIRVVAILASCSSRFAALGGAIERGERETLSAELRRKLRSLRSTLVIAPYLGLIGTCTCLLSAFRGYEGELSGAVFMIFSSIEAALLSPAAGILVAVAATCCYNYLRTRLDSVENEMPGQRPKQPRFLLRTRLPIFPFPVIAASTLAIAVVTFMLLPSHPRPQGLPVRLLKISDMDGSYLVQPIFITLAASKTKAGPDLYLNSRKTPWEEADALLGNELRVRPPQSLAYIQAENAVRWNDVVKAIDVARGLHAEVVLLTVRPNVRVSRKLLR